MNALHEIFLYFLPGDPVIARNYRRNQDPWEKGTVTRVHTDYTEEGPVTHYHIVLDRRTPRPTKGNPKGIITLNIIDPDLIMDYNHLTKTFIKTN